MTNTPERYSPEEALREGMAVQRIADETAKQEGFPETKGEHYEMISRMLDNVREHFPDMVEKLIDMGAEAQALKNELGKEKFQVLRDVAEETTRAAQGQIEALKIRLMAKSVETTSDENFNPKEFIKELVLELTKKGFDAMFSDDRVKEVFASRPDLLERCKKFCYDETLELMSRGIDEW